MQPAPKIIRISLLLFALMFMGQLSSLLAQGTAFTYQGRLDASGSPANGSYDFTFTLFGAASGGTAIAGPVTNAATAVSNGLFIATVDFGNAFNGSSNWLQIAVSTNGANSFGTLTPRQQLTPTPYAISAESISGGINATQLTGGIVPTNVLAGFQGPFFSAIGGGLGNVNYSEYDVIGGGQANNVQSAWGFVGGGYGNSAGSGGYYATVAGGENNNAGAEDATVGGGESDNAAGQYATVSGGDINTAYGFYDVIGGGLRNIVYGDDYNYGVGTIAGGGDNSILVNAPGSFIGGGSDNQINGDPFDYGNSVIAGGAFNLISTNDPHSVIGGGYGNSIQPGDIFFDEGDSVIAGGYSNSIAVAAGFAAIGGGLENTIGGAAGGGSVSVIAGGSYNVILDGYCVIGGGGGNTIATNSPYSTISGGRENSIASDYDSQGDSSIGGGEYNQISMNAPFSAIAGGYSNSIAGDFYDFGSSFISGYFNQIMINSQASVIAGGAGNVVAAPVSGIFSGQDNFILSYTTNVYGSSAILGGTENAIGTDAYYCAIGGGGYNGIGPASAFSVVSGGSGNAAYGTCATVPGGANNFALGLATFAAGYGAQALQPGTFVWSDSLGQSNLFFSTGANQFLIEAHGGVGIGTNAPEAQLHVSSGGNFGAPQVRIDQTTSGDYARLRMTTTATGASWDVAAGGSGATLNFFTSAKPAGTGTNVLILNPNGSATLWGTLAQGSDRAHKENLQAIDPQAVLAKVAAMPITKWNYLTEHGVEHLGPMAQDFYAAFQLGEDDKHITTVDEGGVALAAIQGLNQKLEEKNAEIENLERQNDSLAARLDKLQSALNALTQKQ